MSSEANQRMYAGLALNDPRRPEARHALLADHHGLRHKNIPQSEREGNWLRAAEGGRRTVPQLVFKAPFSRPPGWVANRTPERASYSEKQRLRVLGLPGL
jgi:hypothetical protein